MARSTRIILRGVQGRVRHNHNFGPITQASAVVITAAEWRFAGGIFGSAGRPFLGEANVYVTNIGPHDDEGGGAGGVEYHLHAEAAAPIDVMVTISVLEDVEQVQVV